MGVGLLDYVIKCFIAANDAKYHVIEPDQFRVPVVTPVCVCVCVCCVCVYVCL